MEIRCDRESPHAIAAIRRTYADISAAVQHLMLDQIDQAGHLVEIVHGYAKVESVIGRDRQQFGWRADQFGGVRAARHFNAAAGFALVALGQDDVLSGFTTS